VKEWKNIVDLVDRLKKQQEWNAPVLVTHGKDESANGVAGSLNYWNIKSELN